MIEVVLVEEVSISKKILVADDDQRITLLMKIKLEEKGYAVMTAQDGEEALEKVRTEKPDLLLLDVNMPKLDGDQVYMTLRAQPETKKLPILMLTGLRTEEEVEAEHDENMFSKPVKFEKLFARMRQILGQ